jgi:TatD DNase family protein
MLIDTHSHIYQPVFDDDREEMVNRARLAGVEKILLPNITLESIPQMHAVCDHFPGICHPMMGLHPCDVREDFAQVLDQMFDWFSKRHYVAVGETGIDLYWDKSTLEWQKEAFRVQINWAKNLQLPIVIHARDSFHEIFEVLDELNDERLEGVFHCFTGDLEQARKIMEYGGFLMGIGGVVTFEKAGLDKVLTDIPMEYIVLETDAPYLAPKPYRGKRNESSYVSLVAQKVASILQWPVERVVSITGDNASNLFKL